MPGFEWCSSGRASIADDPRQTSSNTRLMLLSRRTRSASSSQSRFSSYVDPASHYLLFPGQCVVRSLVSFYCAGCRWPFATPDWTARQTTMSTLLLPRRLLISTTPCTSIRCCFCTGGPTCCKIAARQPASRTVEPASARIAINSGAGPHHETHRRLEGRLPQIVAFGKFAYAVFIVFCDRDPANELRAQSEGATEMTLHARRSFDCCFGAFVLLVTIR